MDKIIPNRLKKGDEIRVIAPSRSMVILSEETITIAKTTLENLGYKVTFGKHVSDVLIDEYLTASIDDRLEDLHDAFRDENVKAILTVIGGFNVNQLLPKIDYNLIKNNPKIICGYSDIAALLNAITFKTGLVTYYGPHFSTFGIKKSNEYTIDNFKKIVEEDNPCLLLSSSMWSNDAWFIDQDKRDFIKNEGMKIFKKGKGEGIIVGGNLCTLNLLQGTPYMSSFDNNVILFIEDDGMAGENFLLEFDRNFESLIQCIGKEKIKGIVIGRAELAAKMDSDKWSILLKNKCFNNIPIVFNADFGHTNPMATLPLGGYCKMDIDENINIILENK